MPQLKKTLYIIIVTILTLLIMETILRVLGYGTYKTPKYDFNSYPSFCFTTNALGIALKPGEYNIVINKELQFTVCHNLDSNRVSDNTNVNMYDNILHVYGCSYAYGTGVDDSSTFSFQLQKKLTKTKVINYSVPGYGTLQSYLLLKKNIERKKKPNIVLLAYAPFHEERNLMLRSYQQKLYMGYDALRIKNIRHISYPFLQNSNDVLAIKRFTINDYKPTPFFKYLAVSYMIEKIRIRLSENKIKKQESTITLINEINKLCVENDIFLIVIDVDKSKGSLIVENFCFNNKINYVDISPNFDNSNYKNLPYDNHPNYLAHKAYTDNILKYFKKIKLYD